MLPATMQAAVNFMDVLVMCVPPPPLKTCAPAKRVLTKRCLSQLRSLSLRAIRRLQRIKLPADFAVWPTHGGGPRSCLAGLPKDQPVPETDASDAGNLLG